MTERNDSTRELSIEHRILIQLRRVLAHIVRDLTPPPGAPYPLPRATVDEIRDAFALIVARERELDADRENPDLPVFNDSGATTRIVDFEPDAKPNEGKD